VNPFEAFDTELLVTFTAVFVAGLAAILGIWMERDQKKPPRYAWALSALILLATFVSLMQSYIDKKEQDVIKDDMARLLTTMDRLASESDDPALLELVKSELNAQTRNDPSMVERVAQRVSDEGRDPTEVLAKHLDAAEVEKVTRKGSIKAKATDKVATAEPAPAPAKRAPRPTKDEGDEEEAKPDAKESTAAPARPVMTEEQAKAAAAAAAARMGRPGAPMPPGVVPAPVPPPTEAAPAPTAPPTARAGAPKPTPRAGAAKRPAPKKPKGR
jgi:hypothetical protein